MKIAINDNRRILSIQEEFNSVYPYLKLEFFSMPHRYSCDFSKKMLKHNSNMLANCRIIHNKGDLEIQPLMSVQELEKIFLDEYGLGVQVFRKSGSVWLETTVTDSWTLDEQNRQGESLSRAIA